MTTTETIADVYRIGTVLLTAYLSGSKREKRTIAKTIDLAFDDGLVMRHRAVLDRRDARRRAERKREAQRKYNASEAGRTAHARYRAKRVANPIQPRTGWHMSRSPEQVAAREKAKQLSATQFDGLFHMSPILDDEGLSELRGPMFETHGGHSRRPPEWRVLRWDGERWVETNE